MELKMLSINQLKKGNAYKRGENDDTQDAELTRSIDAKGVLFPLMVVKSGKVYEIVDGNRRLAACKSLKVESDYKIPVLVIVSDASQRIETALIANTVRADADAVAELEAVNLLVNKYNVDVKEVAASI